tara:strand:+ start:3919 stop:4239 length:321 start_codon:yes stop_codon:yes gene_type:complete
MYSQIAERRNNMTYSEQYPPKSGIENKIVLLLGMKGYNKDDIHFKTSLDDVRYLRIGYWDFIESNDFDYIQIHCDTVIDEISWYDDDCGWQFAYDLTNSEGDNNVK